MADKRIKIKSIRIKNFRSIRNCTIYPKDLNIFVGVNDVGKSNVLKALNLFFNNETNYGEKFSFKKDFTFLYKRKSHSAKEIAILIKFSIPDTYQDYGDYTWTKAWNQDGLCLDEITDFNNNTPKPNSRIPGALRRIKYRYVPAVKSREYFKALLGELYTAVFSSLNNPLEKSVSTFSEELRKYTKELSADIENQLGISSLLSFPDDLNDVFKALVFETTCNTNGIKIPLNSRGDGIQAYHIPIILKYIAHEDQKSRQKGSMRICTIWGFEEPENGLELSKSFKLADEFLKYSSELQIFVSTHSPAFYIQKESEKSSLFFVSKEKDSDETLLSESSEKEVLVENMGLMPLIAPFVKEQADKLEELIHLRDKEFLVDLPTLLVEGKTDAELLSIAISYHSPYLQEKLDKNELRIICSKDRGGCTRVSEWFFAWMLAGFRSKVYALLDNDSAGKNTRKKILDNQIYIEKQNENAKVDVIKPSNAIVTLFNNNILIEYEIEHLLSSDFWAKMVGNGYVIARDQFALSRMLSEKQGVDKSINDVFVELSQNPSLDINLLKYVPDDGSKKKIISMLKKENDISTVTLGFKKTLESIEAFFKIK